MGISNPGTNSPEGKVINIMIFNMNDEKSNQIAL
jgi:hypothetical protein